MALSVPYHLGSEVPVSYFDGAGEGCDGSWNSGDLWFCGMRSRGTERAIGPRTFGDDDTSENQPNDVTGCVHLNDHVEKKQNDQKQGDPFVGAVRLIHKPTGVDVRCQSERSQLKNREKAMALLTAKLEALHAEEEAKKHANLRSKQIGTGDRSEKIRTYNFPQNRITDHRIKESWHTIEATLGGDLQPIIDAMHTAEDALVMES